ncbi:YihY/virulence factor BrkB family protein [Okibacterium endophyticum]
MVGADGHGTGRITRTDAPAGGSDSAPAFTRRLRESDNALLRRLAAPATTAAATADRVIRWRPYRVLRQYLDADGNLLAAGMSFQALFAVFAAVFVGFSIAGVWVTSSDDLVEALIVIIDRVVPGLIGEHGLIDPAMLSRSGFFGWTGVISLVSLLWTLIAWLYYTRQAVRTIFSLPPDPRPYLLQKASDLLLALGLGLLLLASAVVSIISTAALSWVLDLTGLGLDSLWGEIGTRTTGLVLAVLIDVVALGTMFRILSNIPIPWRDLRVGAGLGGIALSLLSVASSAVIAGASRNPLLATFAVFIGLLLWFNLVSRVILFSASWIAVRLKDRNVQLLAPTEAELLARLEEARRIVVEADLDDAAADYASARGLHRFVARRRLRRAEHAARRAP